MSSCTDGPNGYQATCCFPSGGSICLAAPADGGGCTEDLLRRRLLHDDLPARADLLDRHHRQRLRRFARRDFAGLRGRRQRLHRRLLLRAGRACLHDRRGRGRVRRRRDEHQRTRPAELVGPPTARRSRTARTAIRALESPARRCSRAPTRRTATRPSAVCRSARSRRLEGAVRLSRAAAASAALAASTPARLVCRARARARGRGPAAPVARPPPRRAVAAPAVSTRARAGRPAAVARRVRPAGPPEAVARR